MNFKGHITAGTVAGLGLSFFAHIFLNMHGSILVQIAAITICFGLLPDLDVTSIPQKWFFRFIFFCLIYFAIKHQFQIATLIAIAAITPLLSQHRGWTHNIFSAIFIPAGTILIYYFIASDINFEKFFMPDNVIKILKQETWIIIPATLGWVTHLFVDYKLT